MVDQALGGEDPIEDEAHPKPAFEAEYRDWLWEKHGVSITADVKASYEGTSEQIAREFKKSQFWKSLPGRLQELNAAHKVERGVPLLGTPGSTPDVDIKSWSSFWEKTYRLNVHRNRRWPGAPQRGWVLPETWFSQVSDIVRTKFIVRYLDGMAFVSEQLARAAAGAGLDSKLGRIAKVEGYYATHVDIEFPIVVSTGIDLATLGSRVEIQVTTELQENIYDLAHRQYASRRSANLDEGYSWQWNYRSDEFASNYLGHVLHYLEGMIMRLREAPDDRLSD